MSRTPAFLVENGWNLKKGRRLAEIRAGSLDGNKVWIGSCRSP
jgi:hypothetical protein